MADSLDNRSTLDANSRVVQERVGGASQLTAGRVIVYKNRSGQEMGEPRIIPPLRNRPNIEFTVPGAEYTVQYTHGRFLSGGIILGSPPENMN